MALKAKNTPSPFRKHLTAPDLTLHFLVQPLHLHPVYPDKLILKTSHRHNRSTSVALQVWGSHEEKQTMKLAVIQVPGQLSPPWRLSQHQGLLELALHPQGAASLRPSDSHVKHRTGCLRGWGPGSGVRVSAAVGSHLSSTAALSPQAAPRITCPRSSSTSTRGRTCACTA